MTRRTTGNRPGCRGALIERSEMAEPAAAEEAEALANFPVADPDDPAEHYWDMYTRRDRVEQFHPESPAMRATAG
ncbi:MULTISPECIES: hypothetical protein [Streptomyces violaceusniger group]|uniref:Uncharacterized protein n=3 Tax=Streptomyces rhizosphaericus TaxID=114699 RepID=A0ABN1S4E8_9ACTN|nr:MULTISPECIES: hypothetical protein [Streptomyces violaceusniger group]